MIKKKLVTIKSDLFILLLMFSIFRCYLVPDLLYELLQAVSIIIVFVFVLCKIPKSRWLNSAIIYPMCVLASGLYNLFTSTYYGGGEFRQALIFSLCIYELFLLSDLYSLKEKKSDFIECMYMITLIFSAITLIFAIYLGEIENSNVNAYPFGNKFSSSYLFIQLYCLYYSRNEKKKNKVVFYFLMMTAIWFSVYVSCSTATIVSIVAFILSLLPKKIKSILMNPKVVVLSLVLSGAAALIMASILQIDVINKLVFTYFNKSITVTGRLVIYDNYIFNLISKKPLLGYGYYNYAMMVISNGIFANAQNGLLQIVLENGFIGAAVVCFLTLYFLRDYKNNCDLERFSLFILLYAMIVAGLFEISIGWCYYIALACLRMGPVRNSNKLSIKKR